MPTNPPNGPPTPASASAPSGTSTLPFALTPLRDDTALYQDGRTGFSHLLAGRPVLGAARPGDPPADVQLHLQDAPITLRYRLDVPSFAAGSAADLARGTAEAFATWRARAPVSVDRANDSWLLAWGVEGAAVAAYDVPPSTPESVLLREDLFVLVRQGAVLFVSWTYPRAFIDEPAYAAFASVAEATMVWDRARWEQRGRVWPASAVLGPGLFGAPTSKYAQVAKELSSAPVLPDERAQVLNVLSGVVSSAGAPWVALAPEVVAGNKRAVLAALRNGRLRAFVEEAFLEIRTAHDLRGLAIVMGRALDARRISSSFPPAPPLEASPITLRARA